MPLDFNNFKKYFKFSLKVVSLLTTIGVALYKIDIINSIYKVT